MKARLTILIALFIAALSFPLLKPQAYLLNSKDADRKAVSQWLKARLKAQMAGNSSELWQREIPKDSSSKTSKHSKTLKNFPVIRQNLFNLFPNTQIDFFNSLESDLFNQTTQEAIVAGNENIQLNDPNQESGSRVQNNTSSAVSGNNIVVAYNDIGTEIGAVSYSNDNGVNWKTTHIPQVPGGRNFGSGVVAASGKTFYYTGLGVNSIGVSAIFISRSTDAGQTWSVPSFIAVPLSNNSFQDKPWIAVDTTNTVTGGNVYVGWTDFTITGINNGSKIVCAVSNDGGLSFSPPVTVFSVDPSVNVQGVTIAIGAKGEVNLAWGNDSVSGITFSRSTDGGQTFSSPVIAAKIKTYELLGTILNSHFSVNGLPSLAVDNSSSATQGNIYVTFNAPSTSNPQDLADVFLARSTDQGVSWSELIKVNDDKTSTDQFMPSVAVTIDGTVGVMWYDRRNDSLYNGMLDVYATTSTDGGKSFNPSVRISTANWGVLTTPIGIRSNYHGDYNQISALTNQAGFFFNWGDDRSGKDPDVYGLKLLSPLSNANNFAMSPITPSQTIVAGQKAEFLLQLLNNTRTINIVANSDSDTINFEFENRGQQIVVRPRTSATTPVGTHPINVTVTNASGVKTSITLRLNVLAQQNFPSLPINISQSVSQSIEPHTAIDQQGTMTAVWVDNTTRNFRVYLSRSINNGNSFSPQIDISKSDNLSINPKVAVGPDKVIHVIWQECPDDSCQVMYSRSTDQGSSFSKPKLISQDIEFSELPNIITNPNGEVVIFWDGARTLSGAKFEVFASKSNDSGERFSFPTSLISDSARNLFTTASTSDGKGNSYLAYESCKNGNCRIEFKRSSNGFDSFTDGAIASGDLSFAIRPSLSTSGNGVVQVAMTVALEGQGNRFEIFQANSFNNGASFSSPKNISKSVQTSNDASVLAINQQVYVAWRDLSSGNPDIFLAKSTDQGNSFSPAINVTSNNTISVIPTLISDSANRVYLSYQDELNGNDDIYYLRVDGTPLPTTLDNFSPTSGPVGTTITITGQELAQTTAVSIAGVAAKFFFSKPTEISVVVPDGAKTGVISLTTSSGTITSKDSFTVVTPIINIISPLGGGVLRGGNDFIIKWQVQGVEPASFDLLLSTDGGATFSMPIAMNLSASDRMFTWAVPKMKVKMARIQLVTRTSNGVSFLTNSNTFKIKAK